MRASLVRFVWRMAAMLLPDNGRVIAPDRFITYQSFVQMEEAGVVDSLVPVYIRIFGESWHEDHLSEDVILRMRREVSGDAIATVMMSDGEVAGFCWGSLLDVGAILSETRTMPTFNDVDEVGWRVLETVLKKSLGNEQVVFFHELAILSDHRGKVSNLQFLIRPLLEMAVSRQVYRALWWTSRRSSAYSLSIAIGFEPIVEVGGLVFLYNPNVRPLLRVLQKLDAGSIAILLRMSHNRR